MGITERKTRQKQALRGRILDAARRIVVREGFAALSMRKIADAIEYSPATLYLHFASRDEIARALCAQGYAQLLSTFEPLAQIADPAERLKGLARAYVAFGVAHPQTYRLIFMEDPTYMVAALAGSAEASEGSADETAGHGSGEAAAGNSTAHSGKAIAINPAAGHESGDAAMRLMVSALEELKAQGRLPASAAGEVLAEAFWATLHGIVALNLTCPVFPTAPLDTIVDVALDAWFGPRSRAQDTPAAPPAASESAPGGAPSAHPSRAQRKPKASGA
ncbi:TetR/AcrR family transcriptional regulator [Paraburkholderia sp.]|uniref:TetR/AcrR family transcriptional regulator n=1 Tax=Paraburkholderia sp. TaxID=1926495 RepID=UPI002F4183A2